jgi:energy-coupling factor transporter ATP-binding protein EcfA2
MYLQKIILKNIKCFKELELDFSVDLDHQDLMREGTSVRRWTTLFGKNALGKSTLLQAMGAVLAGPSAMRELLPVAEGWLRVGDPYGEIYAELLWSEGDAAPRGPKRWKPYVMQYLVSGSDPGKLPASVAEKPTVAEMVPWSGDPGATKADAKTRQRDQNTKDRRLLQETAYAESTQGWLACGYGPFRRLSGGSEQANSIVSAGRRAARFVTLFREDAALTNASKWLTDLHNAAREHDTRSRKTLEIVKHALAAKLFPEQAELAVTAKSAFLKRNGSTEILFQNLSDGYRSMLALSIDLLHWLTEAFPNAENPLNCPGVALIDELDTHLHPLWQRMIGHWLRDKFPNIQFIIATHSPFIAQVADPESGVAAPEGEGLGPSLGNIRLKETAQGVIAEPSAEAARLLGPEQILQSDLFDMSTVLAPQIEQKLERFDQLAQKQTARTLSPQESEELKDLQLELELLPAAPTSRGREAGAVLRRAVQKLAGKIGDIE